MKVLPCLFLFSHTMKMECTDSCPDGPMTGNSVHLTWTTSLIISMQLHPMNKGKAWLLNFTELNIKNSVEDKNQGPDPVKIFFFGTFYFIWPLVFVLCQTIFLGCCQTLISLGKCSIPVRTWVLWLPISHTLPYNEPQQTSSFAFLKGPWERKVMSISARLYNMVLILLILFFLSMFPPIFYQWGSLISYVKLGCKLSQAGAILFVCVTPDSKMLNAMDAKSILGLLLGATALQTITFPLVIRTYD